MVVMRDESREVVDQLVGAEGRACDLHGRAWTGSPITKHRDNGTSESDETSEPDEIVGVLQYVHPDFDQVTEDYIQDFAGEKICCQCGDPTDPMPVWLAERILRAHPDLVITGKFRWEGICFKCAHKEQCSSCNSDGDDEDGDTQDGWEGHAFLH